MKQLAFILLILFSAHSLATDSIDKGEIRKVITSNKDDVRGCYNERLKENPALNGKLVVSWKVDELGKTSAFKEESNTVNDAKLYDCVTGKMKAWKFPPAPKGQVASIRFPFVFAPQKE